MTSITNQSTVKGVIHNISQYLDVVFDQGHLPSIEKYL